MFEKSKLLTDEEIRKFVKIEPFVDSSPPGTISYGLSSFGYDLRIDDVFLVCKGYSHLRLVLDPKTPNHDLFERIQTPVLTIPPHGFVLGRSVEYLEIPENVLGICVGKSTYARCGVIVNITPLEPEWRGRVTIEITNSAPVPCRIYANEGIAQVLFFSSDTRCGITYASKKGIYQDQEDVTLARVRLEGSL